MKFLAQVRFKEKKNAEHLIRAFFKEFDPESSIQIKGNDAQLEVVFKGDPPLAIVDCICYCEVISFSYKPDNDLQVSAAEENVDEQETRNEVEEITTDKEKEDNSEGAKRRVEILNVPEFSEIAKSVSSYNEFATKVSGFLKMGKREELFTQLLIAATEVDEISWKNLENALHSKGIKFENHDRICCSRHVSNELSKYSATILSVILTISTYKDYSFATESACTDENLGEESVDEGEILEKVELPEKTDEDCKDESPVTRVKMNCMPEIPEFEIVLGSIDKTADLDTKVKVVLKAMGWKENDLLIFAITKEAMMVDEIDFTKIFTNARVSPSNYMNVRMIYSTFINSFVKNNGSNEKVKILEFLTELREIVMNVG